MTSLSSPKKSLVIGSVLLDCFVAEQKQYLGGACFNFAYHLHHLIGGLDFVSRVGNDAAGHRILAALQEQHFPCHYIQIDPTKPTKTVQVKKDQHHEPYYIIPNDVATDYLEMPPISPEQLQHYHLVYFGTTIQSSQTSRSTVRQLLAGSSRLKFCDINLRPGKYTDETIAYSLSTCNVLKLNHEELAEIAKRFDLPGDRQQQVVQLADRYQVPTICVTLAEKGSLLYHCQTFTFKKIAKTSVKDTVGAGDAFSAILAIGLLNNWPADRLLTAASSFAADICRINGATPQKNNFYSQWKKHLCI